MKIRKGVSPVLVAPVFVGSLFVTPFSVAQEQKGVTGCCQFEGNEPGCWYPTEPGPCANLNGIFLEGEKCDAEARYCSGYEKKESIAKDSGK